MARRVAADLADVEDDADLGTRQPVVDANDDAEDDSVDEAEDDGVDAAEDGGADDTESEPRQRQRGQSRREAPDPDIMSRLEAAERRAEAAERTARDAQARYEQRQEPVETPEQEAAKLALMTPAEIVQYQQKKIDAALGRHTANIQRMSLQGANAADKASFETFIADKPQQMKRLGADVERKHAELLAQGATPSRMDVMKYMLGERALAAAQSPPARREDKARRDRVERQQARPGTASSDVRRERRGGQTLEDRLAGVPI